MKRHYYYLVAGLQDISLDIHKLIFNQQSFKEELKTGIHADDYALVEKLFLPVDNYNLLHLLQKNNKPFNEKGNYTKEELEGHFKEPEGIPAYMNRFILAFKNKEAVYPDLSPENELTTLFFDSVLSERNEFLANWFRFELNVRNILTVLISRKHKTNYEQQIIGTDDISESIRKSHARDFGLGGEIEYLESLIEISRNDDIQEREKATDMLRWDYLDEVTVFDYFTIEKILAFTIKLGLVERWLAIDKDHGNEMFRKLLKELQASYSLPKTFTEK